MSLSLLALASNTNEAAIAYRQAFDHMRLDHWPALRAASALARVADALTSAVVEAENERPVDAWTELAKAGSGALDAPLTIPLDDLTRLAEIEEVAAFHGVTVPEAIVQLVNEALSGTFAEGYQAALDEHGIVETPPAVVGDGYAHDEPERDDGRTELPEYRLVEIRALGQCQAGRFRFVDPTVPSAIETILDRRGEAWAASVLGRDISGRSAGAPGRPALSEGEGYALVFADAAEDRHALGLER